MSTQHVQVPGQRTANADKDTQEQHHHFPLCSWWLSGGTKKILEECYYVQHLCPAKNPKQSQSRSIQPSTGVYSTHSEETLSFIRTQSSCSPSPKLISTFTLCALRNTRRKEKWTGVSLPLWCSAAAAAAAASRWALSSLAANWAPRTPDKASRLDPPPSARPGWDSPDGCGPIGKPWACWERCWAWSCCCREEEQKKQHGERVETEEREILCHLQANCRSVSTGSDEEDEEKRELSAAMCTRGQMLRSR